MQTWTRTLYFWVVLHLPITFPLIQMKTRKGDQTLCFCPQLLSQQCMRNRRVRLYVSTFKHLHMLKVYHLYVYLSISLSLYYLYLSPMLFEFSCPDSYCLKQLRKSLLSLVLYTVYLSTTLPYSKILYRMSELEYY